MNFKAFTFAIFQCMMVLKSATCNYCHTFESGRNITFCCNNSEEKDGMCIECDDGFVSVDGEPCKICSPGRYGRKCSGRCRCKLDQRCNHVKGCTDYEVTTSYIRWTSFGVSKNNNLLTSGSTGSTEQQSISVQTNTFEWNWDTTINTDTKENISNELTHGGLLTREIIIYSVGAGGLVVVIFLGLCFMCYKTNLFHKACATFRLTNPTIHIQRTDSLYDSIDEQNMIEISPNTSAEKTTDTSTNLTICSKHSDNSDGYLKPIDNSTSDLSNNALTDSLSRSSVKSIIKHVVEVLPYESILPYLSQSHKYSKCGAVQYFEILDVESHKYGKASENCNGQFVFHETKTPKGFDHYLSEIDLRNAYIKHEICQKAKRSTF